MRFVVVSFFSKGSRHCRDNGVKKMYKRKKRKNYKIYKKKIVTLKNILIKNEIFETGNANVLQRSY